MRRVETNYVPLSPFHSLIRPSLFHCVSKKFCTLSDFFLGSFPGLCRSSFGFCQFLYTWMWYITTKTSWQSYEFSTGSVRLLWRSAFSISKRLVSLTEKNNQTTYQTSWNSWISLSKDKNDNDKSSGFSHKTWRSSAEFIFPFLLFHCFKFPCLFGLFVRRYLTSLVDGVSFFLLSCARRILQV